MIRDVRRTAVAAASLLAAAVSGCLITDVVVERNCPTEERVSATLDSVLRNGMDRREVARRLLRSGLTIYPDSTPKEMWAYAPAHRCPQRLIRSEVRAVCRFNRAGKLADHAVYTMLTGP